MELKKMHAGCRTRMNDDGWTRTVLDLIWLNWKRPMKRPGGRWMDKIIKYEALNWGKQTDRTLV